jgi:hypothetical protein
MKCRIQLRLMGRVLLQHPKVYHHQIMSFSPHLRPVCRDWHNHYEKYEMKIDTTHFYNTLASSVQGIFNGFVKSVNWTEEKTSFLVAILNENQANQILLHPSTIWHKLMKQGYRLKI